MPWSITPPMLATRKAWSVIPLGPFASGKFAWHVPFYVELTAPPMVASAEFRAPTVLLGSLITSPPMLAVAAMFTPSVSVSRTVAAPPMTATGLLRVPTLGVGYARAAPPMAATAEFRTPATSAGASLTAPPMAASAAMLVPSAVVAAGAVAAPPPMSASAALLPPGVSAGASAAPPAMAATAAMRAPLVAAGQTVTPPALAAAAAMLAPAVAAGAAVASPVMAATAAMLVPAIGVGASASPPMMAAAAAMLAPTADVTTPGVQFIGATGNEGASITTMPAHQAGDYIKLFIFRDGVQTIPTPPTDGKWQILHSIATTLTTAFISAYMIAESSSEVSGTWTNATGIVCSVYRGMEAFGANGGTNGTASNPSYAAAGTPLVSDGTSWYSADVGHRSTNGTLPAPTGMVNRVQVAGATNDMAVHDTNGGIASWADNGGGTAPVTGETSSGYTTEIWELLKEFSTARNRPKIVNQRTYQANTGNMPAHQVGDMILVFAFNGASTTAPTTPTAGGTVPTFTNNLAPAGANTCAMKVASAVATAANHTLGTWTNATNLIVLVIRGQAASSPIGGSASQATASSLTVNLPAITLAVTDNSSLLLRFSGHRAGTAWNPNPAGNYKQAYDARVSSSSMACCDVQFNTTTAVALTRTITGTASGNFGCTVEVKT